MVQEIPEDLIMQGAPDQILDENELDKFQKKLLEQNIDKIKNRLTNQEVFPESKSITFEQYQATTSAMDKTHLEKYGEERTQHTALTPDFNIRSTTESGYIYQDTSEFQELSKRAHDVFNDLKMIWRDDGGTEITTIFALLSSLKEAYGRVSNQQVKGDLSKLYYLLSFGLTSLDSSDALADCLKDSRQKPEDYQSIFLKLLADETHAHHEVKPVIEKSQELRNKIVKYIDDAGIEFPLPDPNDIIYVHSLTNFEPSGPIINREYSRTSAAAIVHGKDFVLDPNRLTFAMHIPTVWPEMPNEDIEKDALSTTCTIVHESVHFNGNETEDNEPSGSWKEAVKEMLTDYATLTLITRSGIGQPFPEDNSLPQDWNKKTGYHQYIRIAASLIKYNVTTIDQLLEYGLKQDFEGFIKAIDPTLADLDSSRTKAILDRLDQAVTIGPDQYDQLIDKPHLTTEDLFRGTLEFKNQIGDFGWSQAGAILGDIMDKLPEWNDKSFAEFIDWFMASDQKSDRHRLLREYFKRRQEYLKG